MGKRGPAPTPTALKLLRGSRRVNPNEPRPVPGAPTMPADLDAAEAACWHGLVAELDTCPGLLSRADRGILELAARLEPIYRAAAAHVRQHGATVVARDDKGAVKFMQTSPQITPPFSIAIVFVVIFPSTNALCLK